jgi:Tfp pilus assembly protein PilF
MQIVRCHETPAAVAPRVEGWIAKARRIDPGSVVLRLLEAELRSLEARPADAEVIYRELLASNELDATQKAIVSNNLAFHLAKPATVTEAQELIDRAIDEIGPLPDLLDTRGMVFLAAGKNREAVADLQEAVLQASDVKFLHLAWAQLQAGDQSAARQALESGRRKGLAAPRLSPADRKMLGDLEAALGSAEPEPLPPQG